MASKTLGAETCRILSLIHSPAAMRQENEEETNEKIEIYPNRRYLLLYIYQRQGQPGFGVVLYYRYEKARKGKRLTPRKATPG